MTNPPLFDGSRLLSWARRCATELERRRVEINNLNVFPVPDADTGSNMSHTMAAAVAEADALSPGASARDVASALAVGSMRGARGNSGVVLSQVMRGVAQSVSDERLTGAVVAQALAAGVEFVDRAIADPVEGTVITVLRVAAAAAREAEAGGDLSSVATAARDAAREALARTPSQLPALRDAGVVDAGGTGLVILLDQLVNEATGSAAGPGALAEHPAHPGDHVSHTAHLEVMFLFDGPLEDLEAALTDMGGTSLVVARGEGTAGKVHVHSTDAGALIEKAFSMGRVTDLRLEVLPPEPVTDLPERVIVAVTPPGSLGDLYTAAGAVTVAPGDDAVSDVLAAIRTSAAREVILLPNGLMGNAALVAVEKAARTFEQVLTVLPTVRLVSGIAALAVYDETQPLATVAFTMSEAAGEMRTAVIHCPGPRDGVVVTAYGESARFDGTAGDAVTAACARLLQHGGELVSVLFDPLQLHEPDAAELTAQLGAEVRVYPADGLGAVAEIGVE